jgi:Tfp pilus assembly pilus retraction ATPase PilT
MMKLFVLAIHWDRGTIMNLKEIVALGTEKLASDIHITVGRPVIFRIYGDLVSIGEDVLNPSDTKSLVYEALSEKLLAQYNHYMEKMGLYNLRHLLHQHV